MPDRASTVLLMSALAAILTRVVVGTSPNTPPTDPKAVATETVIPLGSNVDAANFEILNLPTSIAPGGDGRFRAPVIIRNKSKQAIKSEAEWMGERSRQVRWIKDGNPSQ